MNIVYRISVLIALISCVTSTQAQSLSIIDSMGNILTDDTIFVQISVNDYDIQVPAGVENTSGNALDVNVTRIEEDVLPNTSSFFCWGSCTGVITSGQTPVLTPSGSVAINGGEIVPGNGDGFLFHYDPNYQAGTSLFKMTFFDVNDTLDKASVYISITSVEDNVSIQEHETELLTVYPNPAQQFVNVQIPEGVRPTLLRVINVYGQEVLRMKNTLQFTTLDLSFESGIYFVELYTSDGQVAVKKFIKR